MFNKELNKTQTFFCIFIGIFLFSLPLILSNTLYFDDNTRVLTGKAFWDVDGRPLTDIIFYFLNSNFGVISNIQPLPLLLSILSLSLALSYTINKCKYPKTFFNIIPFLVLVCNPFFLQNLSYQFDCIGMSLSIVFVLLAFFYKPNKNQIYTYLYPIFFLAITNSFYQPTSNVFLSLFFANIIINFKSYDSLIKETIYYSFIYIGGMICYYLATLFIFPVKIGRADFIHFKDIYKSFDISSQVLYNFFSSFIHDYFLVIIFISTLFITINYLIKIFTNYKTENRYIYKILATFITILAPFFLLISLWGPFLFITELFFNPREFPGVGVILFIAILSLYNIDQRKYISNTFICFFILYLFSFSYLYGNTISNQRNYENNIYNSIVQDINRNPDFYNANKIEIYGETGIAPKALNSYTSHPFLKILAQPSYRWVQRYIIKSYGLDNVSTNVSFDDEKEWKYLCSNNIQPIGINSHYEIFKFKDHVSVWIKKEKKKSICEIQPEKFYDQFSKGL